MSRAVSVWSLKRANDRNEIILKSWKLDFLVTFGFWSPLSNLNNDGEKSGFFSRGDFIFLIQRETSVTLLPTSWTQMIYFTFGFEFTSLPVHWVHRVHSPSSFPQFPGVLEEVQGQSCCDRPQNMTLQRVLVGGSVPWEVYRPTEKAFFPPKKRALPASQK